MQKWSRNFVWWVVLFVLAAGMGLPAATITWTNIQGGSWTTPANWNPNVVPGTSDDVRITNPGAYRVLLEPNGGGVQSDIKVNSLVLGAGTGSGIQTLLITNRSLIAGSIVVTGKGLVRADGQSLSIVGPTTVTDGGVFNIATRIRSLGGLISSTSVRLNPLVVTNGGTVNASSDSPIYPSFTEPVVVARGGFFRGTRAAYQRFTVETGGVAEFAGDFSIGSVSGPGFLTNSGVINFTNSSGSLGETAVNNASGTLNVLGQSTLSAVNFLNSGTVHARAQSEITLNLTRFVNSSGLITNSAGLLKFSPPGTNIAGTFGAAAGTTTQFVGSDEAARTVMLGFPLNFTGGGQFQFVSGRLRLHQEIPSRISLTGGILELTPGFQGGFITNLTLDGISLANTLPVSGTFNMRGGRLDANFSINNGGQATLRQATLAGALRVVAGGKLQALQSLELVGGITNAGTLIFSNVIAKVSQGAQAGILNQPTGLVQCFGSNDLRYAQSANFFINQGRLVQSSGPGTLINVANFDNASGTVTNLNGLLQLSNVRETLRGTYYAAQGATNQLFTGQRFFGGDNNENSPIAPGTPLLFTGPGVHQLNSGFLTLSSSSIPNLQLVGGTVFLAPGFQGGSITNLSLQGALLTNSLPVKGLLNLVGSTVAADLIIGAGGIVNAGPGGQFSGRVTNAPGGQLLILGGFNLNKPLYNSGAVRLQEAPPSANVPPGFGTILFVSHNGVSTSGAVINEPTGTIEFASDLTGFFDFDFAGGQSYLLNRGQILKTGDGFSSLGLAFQTNAGSILVQRGTMQMSPSILQPTSQLNIRLNSGSDYGRFEVFGPQTLAGSFTTLLNSGYVPGTGTSFNVFAYGGRQGNFSSLNLPSAVSWQSVFGTTNLTLTVTGGGPPLLNTPERVGTNLILKAQGGTPGMPYTILTTTNLSLPLANWSVLRTGTYDSQGRLTLTNGISPATRARFFLLNTP